ncbi:MAG: DUF4231 domain-containing protein [Streptomyces sp.]|nr:DUF4231 domain-containing protein [Streptomyces sp.]
MSEPVVPAARGTSPDRREEKPADVVWQRLQEQIRWFDKKSESAQHQFRRLKMATLVLAAGIPVAVAASAPNWVAALMGALVAVVEGTQQLFKYQENWISYRSVCENLRREEHLYLAHAGPYATAQNPELLLAEQVERLGSQETTQWAERETAR